MVHKRAPRTQICFFLIGVMLFTLSTPSVLALEPGAQSNTPLFLPAVTYVSGGARPFSLAVADVNGDGVPDVFVPNVASDSVGVLLANGDGTLRPSVAYFSGGHQPDSLAVADVNGDGVPDLIVANANICCSDGIIGVLLGNGDGTFQTAVPYGSGAYSPQSVVAADVNGDGKIDLVVANFCILATCSDGMLGVLLGNGNGTFQPVSIYDSGGDATSALTADVNSDGKLDLIVANAYSGTIGVLLGNGDGTFQPVAINGSSGFWSNSALAVADVNGDGTPDLIVANRFNYNSGSLSVLLGKGDGTFETGVGYSSGGLGPEAVAVADVNGDGKPDLLAGNANDLTNEGTVGVLLGNGEGTFQAPLVYDSGGLAAFALAASDLNGDHQPDLLIANYNSNTVGVLLNNTGSSDTTPPLITLSVTPSIIWPPTGRMIPVTVSGTIIDTGSGIKLGSAEYTVRDEYGLIQPQGKIALDANGNYSFTVLLRASREQSDLDGRRYTIRVNARDNAGNRSAKTRAVTVPRERESSL